MPNGGAECLGGAYNASIQDWSDNVGHALSPGDRVGRNGTYNRNLLSGRAAGIIGAHDAAAAPLFMYLAFQDAHEGCARPDKLGVQAPLATVELYNTTELDTYKIQGAMLTELDYGVGEVVAALKAAGMYDNTLCVPLPGKGEEQQHYLLTARPPLLPYTRKRTRPPPFLTASYFSVTMAGPWITQRTPPCAAASTRFGTAACAWRPS